MSDGKSIVFSLAAEHFLAVHACLCSVASRPGLVCLRIPANSRKLRQRIGEKENEAADEGEETAEKKGGKSRNGFFE
jgi:hypothetical protein